MSLHACHESKMLDENFVFNFEHKIAGNQLWSHLESSLEWRGSVVLFSMFALPQEKFMFMIL